MQRCESCNQPLLQKGGFAGTGLCGPCCTGEAATIHSVTSVCSCGALVEHSMFARRPECFHKKKATE